MNTPRDDEQLSEQERLDRLRLARTENVGPVTFRQLLARYGSATSALSALPELAGRGGRKRPLVICPPEEAEKERDAVTQFGGEMIFPGEAGYPRPLAALDDAPMVLTVIGDRSLLERDAVAIVGARNASTNGRNFARRLAATIAEEGLCIVSGLARGIDAAAHSGAVDRGTAAVLAGGVDVIYPRENEALYREIAEKGLLVSEMPCGVQPQARHFPRRNRIISGLSLGVVVVEAALRSGSLITARYAGEQGRDVFAVPGSPLDPRCRGANDLIRKGAVLTEDAADVLNELEGMRRRAKHVPQPALPLAASSEPAPPDTDPAEPAQSRIESLIGPTPLSVDDIIRDSGLSAGSVWSALLELELAGRIERQPGGMVARIIR